MKVDLKLAIVTGAGSGIGAGIAKMLAARGELVTVCDKDAAAAHRTCDDINSLGGKSLAFVADVTNEDAMVALVAAAMSKGGELSTVVAAAGIGPTGLVTEMPTAQFLDVINVNLVGPFLLARTTLPYLEKARGSFTVIGSDAGLNGCQEYAAYCASKHGINGLVKVLALDHGPKGVRCNVICPGYVETPLLDRLLQKLGESSRAELESGIPLGKFATVADVANIVGFVTSPAGSHINGAILSLDGGTSAGLYIPQPPGSSR